MVSRPRFLAVQFPAFRLERCGYASDELAALVSEARGALRVVALTPAAAAAGLRVGLSAAEARALLPELAIEALDASGEQRDFHALCVAFGAFSDRVRPLECGAAEGAGEHRAIVLAIDGMAQWFASEREGLAEVLTFASRLGHASRAAIADDPVVAGALATHAGEEGVVVSAGDSVAQAAALAGLPLTALPLRPAVVEALHALGIERIGAWAVLDPASVADRYGEDSARLHRLARGRVPPHPHPERLGAPIVEAELPEARVVFPEAVAVFEPVAFVLPGICAQLAAQLAQRGQQAVQLGVRLRLDGGVLPVQRVAVRVGRPTAHPGALERVLRVRLQNVRFAAPVAELLVRVEEACVERSTQLGLHDRAQAVEAIPELVARLADTLGETAVFSPRLCDTWRPEAAWRGDTFAPGCAEPGVKNAAAEVFDARGRIDPVAVHERWGSQPESPRPALLAPEPEPIDVREEGGQPAMLRFPEGWEPVRRVSGPECLSGEWWSNPFDRAYWVVEVRDATWWIYRDTPTCRWFVHGWFD